MALTYREAVAELEGRGIMPNRPPSLEPVREAMRRLALSFPREKVVVVAGTNGKGSVSVMLDALLRARGFRVGLYTSPHLIETTERIRLDGQDASERVFLEAYLQAREATADLALSHFEMLTVMALLCFAGRAGVPAVEWTILEVGLGGLWDATNAVPHHFSVITRLGLDHENLLGKTLPEIARNKLGIVSSECGPEPVVIHAPFPEEAEAEMGAARARVPASRWITATEARLHVTRDAEGLPEFAVETRFRRAPLSLPGLRGAENAALALSAFEAMGFDPRPVLSAISRTRWPGRMERARAPGARCPIFLSGDHNPQGVASLIELLAYYPRKRLHLLVGIGRDKDAGPMLDALFALPSASVYLTETPFKGRTLAEYGPSARERAAGAWADPREAIREVVARADSGDLVVVTGSLYLVGAVKKVVTTN